MMVVFKTPTMLVNDFDSGREECARKVALLEDIRVAMGELMNIHNGEMEALMAEDFNRVGDLKARLQEARKRKADLIEEYREHVIVHGC